MTDQEEYESGFEVDFIQALLFKLILSRIIE